MPSSGGSSSQRPTSGGRLATHSGRRGGRGHGFPSRGSNSSRGSGRGGRGGRNSPPSHYRPSNASDDKQATKRLRWGSSHELNCILAAGDSDSDDREIQAAQTETADEIPELATHSHSSDEEISETPQVHPIPGLSRDLHAISRSSGLLQIFRPLPRNTAKGHPSTRKAHT
jgi:hypothetical protein